TDFFTPVVDDPYDYGMIAAANALSDIYAMGGRPLLALNIAAFPADLPPSILADVMRGAAEKVREAGAIIAGGHTIQDKEPKVGLAVVGIGHPDELLIKGGAQPGDVLMLTKPLGTGCITTAAKSDRADDSDIAEAIGWMKQLNRAAAEAARAAGARAATDITGFGLLGHATEMAETAGVTLVLRLRSDVLMLTKPLGTGCITTAAKSDRADDSDIAEAIGWMKQLNRAAAEAARAAGARAATDITGFGLLGHATEMAETAGVTLVLRL